MNKIGVFYGSTTGTTEDLARRIAEKLDVPSAHVFDVSKLTEALVNEYDVLVLGSSTWGAGELQDDWYDGVKVLKKWLKSKISDLSHYQNFYEFPIKSLNYLV
uniref:flavodoxin domain-containing protein n=1 Tax=Bacteroides TaxID=816 RepID=UPI002675781E